MTGRLAIAKHAADLCAPGFCRRRGLDLVRLYRNAVDGSMDALAVQKRGGCA